MQRRARGFTFIELMLVAVIIGVLAAVAVPAYTDYLARSQVAEGLVLAEGVKKAVLDYYAQRGKLPPDNQAAGVAAPEQLRGSYVARIEVTDGSLRIDFDTQRYPKLTGQLWLQAKIMEGSPGRIVWYCHSKTLNSAYLPNLCKQGS